jgi:hypothetical protein
MNFWNAIKTSSAVKNDKNDFTSPFLHIFNQVPDSFPQTFLIGTEHFQEERMTSLNLTLYFINRSKPIVISQPRARLTDRYVPI